MRHLKIGDTFTWKRTFSRGDVLAFSNVTQDFGSLHTMPNQRGHVRVHSLLIASIATKMGGDLNYFSKSLEHTFMQPVYTGDTIQCTMTIEDVQPYEDATSIEMSLTFHNERGELVATGHGTGDIPRNIS